MATPGGTISQTSAVCLPTQDVVTVCVAVPGPNAAEEWVTTLSWSGRTRLMSGADGRSSSIAAFR